jgi:hypothetical protein
MIAVHCAHEIKQESPGRRPGLDVMDSSQISD